MAKKTKNEVAEHGGGSMTEASTKVNKETSNANYTTKQNIKSTTNVKKERQVIFENVRQVIFENVEIPHSRRVWKKLNGLQHR